MGCLSRFGFGFFSGGLVGGAVGATAGVIAGATGSAILAAAGHAGYSTSESANATALGTAVLAGGATALKWGYEMALGKFERSGETTSSGFTMDMINYVGSITLGGMAGNAILNGEMSLGAAAAASAVGAAVTAIPASCAMICVAVPLILAVKACADRCLDSSVEEDRSPYFRL